MTRAIGCATIEGMPDVSIVEMPGESKGRDNANLRALAYYYDHQVEMDERIEEGLRLVAGIKAELGESPLRLKLRARGLLS